MSLYAQRNLQVVCLLTNFNNNSVKRERDVTRHHGDQI